MPIREQAELCGFVFFNASRPGFCTPTLIRRLSPYRDLIAQLVLREVDTLRAMQTMVRVIMQISAVRDGETGAHLARMARYTRLIARCLAPAHGLSDEFVQNLFQFAPIHDVGKIGVPDHVLLKPAPLTAEEFAVMKTHVERGVEIFDVAVAGVRFASPRQVELMRTIIASHHERLDGSGYPLGLAGDGIPLAARIVAVADVFDALTSRRPYKPAWRNEDAIAQMRREAAAGKLDSACVEALAGAGDEIRAIQAQFVETVNG